MLPSRSVFWQRLAGGIVGAVRGAACAAAHVSLRYLPAPAVTFTGPAMGTYYRISTIPGDQNPDSLHEIARREFERVEALMSVYRPDSEVSRFNATRDTDWFTVSPDTARCVQVATEVTRRSGGLYDITAGPLVDLWGFGPGGQQGQIPNEDRIAEVSRRVGVDLLEVRLTPPALRKKQPDVAIVLASVAKGLAVDLAADALERSGVTRYCVEIGGEVRASGLNSLARPWQIAIEAPQAAQGAAACTVSLRKGAIASSGDYRIYREDGGRQYAHILDPRTGRPVSHNLASVSVRDRSCARADAWATALMVAGPEQGYELAVREKLAAFFILRTGDGFTELWTPRWP